MMKRVVLAAALLFIASPLVAQTASLSPQQIAQQYGDSLMILQFKIEDQANNPVVRGLAICIDPKGIFMTQSIDSRLPIAQIKEMRIVSTKGPAEGVEAKLMGIEPMANLAFIQTTSEGNFKAVQFARSANATLGQSVVSLGLKLNAPGSPLELGLGTVSSTMRLPQQTVSVVGDLGSAGSVVVGQDGNAIGLVMSAPFANYQMQLPNPRGQASTVNVGLRSQESSKFFMPVDEFADVLQNIPSDGKVRRISWLGINKFEVLDPIAAQARKIDRTGIVVDQVIEGKPAAQAGIRDGDVIVAVNGQPIEDLTIPNLTLQNFSRQMAKLPAGQAVEITVIRGDQEQKSTVTPDVMPTLPDEAPRITIRDAGFIIREKVMLDQYLDPNPTAQVEGLVVMAVAEGSTAAEAGLRGGDLITRVDGKPVKTVSEFRDQVKLGQPLNVTVQRGNQTQDLKIEVPKPAAATTQPQ